MVHYQGKHRQEDRNLEPMLRIYALLLAIVLVLSGTAALALIRGGGLGVGIFHLTSAAIFAWLGFSRRNPAIIRGVVGTMGGLFLLSGLLVAFTMSILGFPFEGKVWEAGLVQAALGGLTMACAVLLPCDD
jgi:hypothetical protein